MYYSNQTHKVISERDRLEKNARLKRQLISNLFATCRFSPPTMASPDTTPPSTRSCQTEQREMEAHQYTHTSDRWTNRLSWGCWKGTCIFFRQIDKHTHAIDGHSAQRPFPQQHSTHGHPLLPKRTTHSDDPLCTKPPNEKKNITRYH